MAANSGQGTLLKLSGTTIAQRVKIKPAEHTRAKLDTTDLDSTWKTLILGIPDGGELEMEGNYDAGQVTHASLWSSFGTGTIESWTLVLADTGGASFAFSGGIISLQIGEAGTDSVQKFSIKIAISGAVVLTP